MGWDYKEQGSNCTGKNQSDYAFYSGWNQGAGNCIAEEIKKYRKTDKIKKAPTQQYIYLSNEDLSARSGVRTLDTLIKSQVLCQLS